MRTPSASAYFEGAALIGGRPAYLIAQTMRRTLDRELRANGGGHIASDLAEALVALDRAGRVWLASQEAAEAAEVSEVAGTEALVGCPQTVRYSPPLPSALVALRLGVSDRRVRQLALSGELPGRRVRNKWEFDPAVVSEYQRNRG